MALTLAGAIGFAAGVLVMGVGLLILSVAPRSRVHRFFFAFALADGLSTCFFRLRDMVDPRAAPAMMWLYFATYIVFVALLLVFGLTFPRPVHDATARHLLFLVSGAMTAAFVLHLIDPGWFWSTSPDGTFPVEPGEALVQTFFVMGVALLLVRTTRLMLGHPSESHRRQTAMILGGIALGYGSFATTSFIAVLRGGVGLFVGPRIDFDAVRLSYVITTFVLIGCAVAIALRSAPGSAGSRAIAFACFGGLAALTLASLPAGDAAVLSLLRGIGLLAYPILVAVAMLRFGLFHLDARTRRLAIVTSVLALFGAVSIVAQFFLQQMITPSLASPLDSDVTAGLAASFVAAGLAVPATGWIRKALARLAPLPESTEFEGRRLDVYRHGVEGVIADGVKDIDSSSVLQQLRASLNITQQEHARVLASLAT